MTATALTKGHTGSAEELWLLTGLFAIRVGAQPLTLWVDLPFMPRFDDWQSGVVAYPWLVASQIIILLLMMRGARQVSAGVRRLGRTAGIALLVCGALYFAVMTLRLLLGATILKAHPWFDRPLPAAFHLVLATYVLAYGRYQYRDGPKI